MNNSATALKIDPRFNPGPLRFRYRNWKGEVSERSVSPSKIYYGSTEWHPAPQYFLLAYDNDRQAERSFALADILEFLPVEPPEPQQVKPAVGDMSFDAGTNKVVHSGDPQWRIAPFGLSALIERTVVMTRTDQETSFHLKGGHQIGRIWRLKGWKAFANGFEFWGLNRLNGSNSYIALMTWKTREEAEDFLITVFQQAGAIVECPA